MKLMPGVNLEKFDSAESRVERSTWRSRKIQMIGKRKKRKEKRRNRQENWQSRNGVHEQQDL